MRSPCSSSAISGYSSAYVPSRYALADIRRATVAGARHEDPVEGPVPESPGSYGTGTLDVIAAHRSLVTAPDNQSVSSSSGLEVSLELA